MAYQISPPNNNLFTPEANDGTAFNWRGSWMQGRTYYENEAVSYTYNGLTSSYRANKTTTLNPAFSPIDWEIISGIAAGEVVTGEGNLINVPFAFGDASPKFIYNAPVGKLILTCSIIITTPFNGINSTLSVGDVNNNERLLKSSSVYIDEIGEYTSNPCFKYSQISTINLYINLGSGVTSGEGNLILEI